MNAAAATILCNLLAFALGYIVGRVNLLVYLLGDKEQAGPVGFFQKNTPAALRENGQRLAKVADIDSSKFVAPISTAGMERTDTAALGKMTTTEDDIQASVSKLAQLKSRP
jgi:hypothetical protein